MLSLIPERSLLQCLIILYRAQRHIKDLVMNLWQGRKCVSEMINSEKFGDDEQQETRKFISLLKLVFFVCLLLVVLFCFGKKRLRFW